MVTMIMAKGFVLCRTDYTSDNGGGVRGDEVYLPVRRIALVRRLGTLNVTAIETVNARCYYAHGLPDDVMGQWVRLGCL